MQYLSCSFSYKLFLIDLDEIEHDVMLCWFVEAYVRFILHDQYQAREPCSDEFMKRSFKIGLYLNVDELNFFHTG